MTPLGVLLQNPALLFSVSFETQGLSGKIPSDKF